jgi:hypothetical protein
VAGAAPARRSRPRGDKENDMYARVGYSRIDAGTQDRSFRDLREKVTPRIQQLPGFVGGYWLEPVDGRGIGVLLFDSREAAESPRNLQPGDHPSEGVTIERVEVREVVGSAVPAQERLAS